ncbi:EI24 domain-containing protein [Sulfurovum sp.]|uniref:EI24 domain-containing protein n=1 Tax=Sulfurovum sp. TaxID=1969726 RepID=UPI0025DC27B4|nr:EI24 domain-containing protein [Sulfurovum sp.]
MKDVMNAIIFGFKEILTWNTMKYALMSGIVITVLWIGIGYMLWDPIVSLSSRILELVPFSMVRANGAWMLSSFLWFQLVLLTFALVFAFFGNLVLKSVSEEKYTSFSVLVALGSAIIWGIVWFFKGNYIYHEFLKLLTWLPFETIEKSIAFFIGFYFLYNAIIVTMVFVTSLFSEPLIASVEKRHFKEDEVVRDHIFSSVGYTIRDSLIFIIASLVAFPLLFIPVLNIAVQLVLWIWLIKDTVSYDAAALTYEKVNTDEIKQHRFAIWLIATMTTLFNFIPVFNIFGPFFGEISMFHYFKNIKK